MSKRQKKQSPENPQIDVPIELALSLLRPDELEKLQRYVIYYLQKYGSKDEAKVGKSEELPMVSITKPFLVKLQSSTVQELAMLHHCTLSISEEHQDAHVVTFPPGTRLAKGEAHCYPLHLPDGYICTLVWNDGYFYWNEEAAAERKEDMK